MSRNQEIGIEALTELALDLRWSSSHSAEELWAQLDPELWALPWHPSAAVPLEAHEILWQR